MKTLKTYKRTDGTYFDIIEDNDEWIRIEYDIRGKASIIDNSKVEKNIGHVELPTLKKL